MRTATIILILSSLLCTDSARAAQAPAWLIGYWAQVADEDGRPGDDTLRFRKDGFVVVYGPKCQALPPSGFHLNKGNIYATFETPKGLISAVYVPSQNHQRLTFTSPRTGNNAVYAPAKRCIPVDG